MNLDFNGKNEKVDSDPTLIAANLAVKSAPRAEKKPKCCHRQFQAVAFQPSVI